MTDWAVGDLAVCVERGEIFCEHGLQWTGGFLGECAPSTVTVIAPATAEWGRVGHQCGCVVLNLADGSHGVAQRFRKIRPDEHQGNAEDWALLLETAKPKQLEPISEGKK